MADDFTKKRVTAFTIAIARVLGSSDQEVRGMARGAFLHDLDSDSIPFADASEIVAAQHESYDGTGSPRGLKAEEIPLGARILRVALVFDTLTTGSLPGRAVSISDAKEEIRRASEALFDPKVVDAFLGMPESIWADLIREISEDD
jgi:HD-GYP domain-containing protein (c-di-GMP phosphodiesterase class II)